MGDRVEPGELLVELESEDADLAVRQAEHQLMAELAKLGLKELPEGEFDVSTVPAVVQAEVALDQGQAEPGPRALADAAQRRHDAGPPERRERRARPRRRWPMRS